MDAVLLVGAGLIGVVVGALLGYKIGQVLRDRASWTHWTAYAVALLVGIAIAAVGAYLQQMWAFVGGMAFIGGSLTGLKYGVRQVVPPWEMSQTAERIAAELDDEHS